jgi:hypothetical protein
MVAMSDQLFNNSASPHAGDANFVVVSITAGFGFSLGLRFGQSGSNGAKPRVQETIEWKKQAGGLEAENIQPRARR